MTQIGETLVVIGKAVMPISFAAYLLVRWFEHFWGNPQRYSTVSKTFWYIMAGILTFQGDVYVNTVVGYMCFMEGWHCWLSYRQSVRPSTGRNTQPQVTGSRTGVNRS